MFSKGWLMALMRHWYRQIDIDISLFDLENLKAIANSVFQIPIDFHLSH